MASFTASSKREIIIAVISDQLNRELKRVRDTFSSQDLLDGIRQYFERESSQAAKHSGSGLLPEVVAEASRDTTIASALNSYRENIQMEVTDAYRRHLASQGDLRDDDWILQRAAVIALAVETVSLLLTTQTIDDLRQKLRAIETMIEDMVD